MLIPAGGRLSQPVPSLARWCPGAGIVAAVGASLVHGLGQDPVGAWPALVLAGAFELLMTLIRAEKWAHVGVLAASRAGQPVPVIGIDAPPALTGGPSLEQAIRAWHSAGHIQRELRREQGSRSGEIGPAFASWADLGGLGRAAAVAAAEAADLAFRRGSRPRERAPG
jgi:hypothetical protein